jgi:hypothetical protein
MKIYHPTTYYLIDFNYHTRKNLKILEHKYDVLRENNMELKECVDLYEKKFENIILGAANNNNINIF